MSLSLSIAVLVGVRAGRMLDQLHLHDMEEKISNLTFEVLKEKIFNRLEILYQPILLQDIYSDLISNGVLSIRRILLNRRNIPIMSMPIESMLIAVNSKFFVFSVSSDDMMGQSFASLVPTVALRNLLLVRGTIAVESINSIQGSGPFSSLGERIRF
ncbi:hypothetical protein M9H77_30762 [Catharanthus roseus]|uniref:Uncharacterized protein n=1 Tax=Catharanthus roseus TaxID=4058 RepID=A0ACB9ZY56_CATRO|nr:hypothetical protein M9H77_30762 [Catharanthus roseus]